MRRRDANPPRRTPPTTRDAPPPHRSARPAGQPILIDQPRQREFSFSKALQGSGVVVARQLSRQNDVLNLVNDRLNDQLSVALAALRDSRAAQSRLHQEKKSLEARAVSAEALVHKLTKAFQIKEAQLAKAKHVLAQARRETREGEVDAAIGAARASVAMQRDAAEEARLMARISEAAAVAVHGDDEPTCRHRIALQPSTPAHSTGA